MFYLIAAAMAALSAGDAPAQRVVKVAADYLSADFGQYGDADGDGVLERLGKFWKVYDYPEGTIPDPERDDRYCIPWGDSEYYRVKDGAAYYRVLPPDPAVSMATYYPQDREPDFSEGGYDFFRITSVGGRAAMVCVDVPRRGLGGEARVSRRAALHAQRHSSAYGRRRAAHMD